MKILLIVALLAATAAQAAFKCKDEKGVNHFGDTPPPQCANVIMYETSKSGTVIRTINPAPTAEQLKAKQEESTRQLAADKAAGEQRRKDVALLSTYSSPKDIDTSRDINLKPIEGRIKVAQDRVKAVEKRQKEIEDELEFYKAGKGKSSGKTREPPAQLMADLERAKNEKTSLVKSIADYGKEMDEVRARYESDKKRLVELKEMQREGKLDLRDPKEIEATRKVDPSKPAAKR